MSLAFAACSVAASGAGGFLGGLEVGDRVRVRDKSSAGWTHGTVSKVMPLRVFPDGWTFDGVWAHVERADEAPYQVGERAQVRDLSSHSWMNGTVSKQMPLRVFADGWTYDDVWIYNQHLDEAPFQVGERVQVRESHESAWMHGTVSTLLPLRVFSDGSTGDDVFTHVQHTGEAPFQVGERVQVRESSKDDWMNGTVSKQMPLRVFPDGWTHDDVFINVEHDTAESCALPLTRGAYLLIMCANLFALSQ